MVLKWLFLYVYKLLGTMSHLVTHFPFERPGAHIQGAGRASVARGLFGLAHRSNLDSPLY